MSENLCFPEVFREHRLKWVYYLLFCVGKHLSFSIIRVQQQQAQRSNNVISKQFAAKKKMGKAMQAKSYASGP